MNILNKKIILASKSPRRSQLLQQAGFRFEIKTQEVEETYPDSLKTEEVAGFLARKKARAARSFIQKDEIILAADSVVILNDTIYGKPKDYDDAVHILKQLSGNIHHVITGVCLLSITQERVFSDTSKVYFEPLTEEEIHYYITHYQPFDKAGAYAIQEWIGLCKIRKIEGTYANIMGLPVQRVYEELEKMMAI